jgi:hypothetical protein
MYTIGDTLRNMSYFSSIFIKPGNTQNEIQFFPLIFLSLHIIQTVIGVQTVNRYIM